MPETGAATLAACWAYSDGDDKASKAQQAALIRERCTKIPLILI